MVEFLYLGLDIAVTGTMETGEVSSRTENEGFRRGCMEEEVGTGAVRAGVK